MHKGTYCVHRYKCASVKRTFNGHHLHSNTYVMDVSVCVCVCQSLLISLSASMISRMTAHVFTLKPFWGTK